MTQSVLSDLPFHSEEAAFAYVEGELWPEGPICPHCESTSEKIGRVDRRSKPSRKHPEGVPVIGLRKCYACRETFTVRKGTIFEDSHLPLRLWLQAIHLLCASKKGMSTRQLQRMLGCGLKTAWHLGHRIRHSMSPGAPAQLGGSGKTVEADETELARSRKTKRPLGFRRKTHNPIVMRHQMSFSRRSLLKASAASAVMGSVGAPFVARALPAEFTYKFANNLPDSHP